ncbi:MAG: pseudoazurin [Pseudomonadota bacterium]
MSEMRMTELGDLTRRSFVAFLASLPFVSRAIASDNVVEVKMLNRHPDNKKIRNVFLPRVVKIKPGETIKFVSVDKGHNSESLKGMIPEGAEKWKSKVSKDFELTIDKPGIYGYKCTPHATLGMVGMIIVEGEGMTANLETAKAVRHRGKAKKVWAEIWAEVEEKGLLQTS